MVKIKYGDIVRNKKTGKLATCHYSRFGVSLHRYDEIDNCLGKGLAQSWSSVIENYEVVDMPEGYEWDESMLYIKKVKNER